MTQPIEIWGVNDPNVSAQLALACKLELFQREAGLDVQCRFIESGSMMADEVLRAEVKPFALTQTPITALLLHEHDFPTKLVAPLADIAGTQQVIVRKESQITTPADLHGKQVGIPRGAAVSLALQNMAKDCNVDLASLKIVDLLPHEQLEAFREGTLDVIAAWEPWTTKAQVFGGEFYFSGNRSEIPGIEGDTTWLINQSCFIVPDSSLEDHPDLVIALLKVFRKATDLLNNHRNTVLAPLAEFFGLSKVELMLAMQKNTYSLAATNLFRLGILEFRNFLYNTQQISFQFPEESLYDSEYLKLVDSSLVLLESTHSQHVNILNREGIYYHKDFCLRSQNGVLKFLIADDSRFVRTSLSKAVQQIGGHVIAEAATGSEVIEKFAHLRPDVITMDLSMPEVSGLDAIKTLRQIDPGITIIVISGADLQEVREEVFDLGVSMFVTKPFEPADVANIFRKQMTVN